MKYFAIVFTLLCLIPLSGGCGLSSHISNERTVVTSHNPACLRHLKQGRDFVDQERYELAKEQYLMAVAACDEGEARNTATRELRAVDMMIQTQR